LRLGVRGKPFAACGATEPLHRNSMLRSRFKRKRPGGEFIHSPPGLGFYVTTAGCCFLPPLLSDAVQFFLILDDLLEDIVWSPADGNLAAVDHQRRRLIDIQILGQLH